MRTSDIELLGLLPALGLLGCASAGGATNVAAAGDAALTTPEAATIDGWIEHESRVAPLSSGEAARRSSELAFAAGDYQAAHAYLAVAQTYEPELDAIHLASADAEIALGDFSEARESLSEVGELGEDPEVTRRLLQIRELEHDQGTASCEATVGGNNTAIQRHADFLSVWNELRAQLPAGAALSIPTDADDARDALCIDEDGCREQVTFVRLDGVGESIVGLLIELDVDELWLVPDVLRPDSASCEDETEIGVERHGDLVRVRGFTDTREPPSVDDWRLDMQSGLGTIISEIESANAASSGYYAGAGYGSSGYAGSGYQYQYGSSGYYGCGGGYDEYDGYYYDDHCEAVSGVARDIFIDLSRKEILLDIVRTGPSDAGLGRVTLDDRSVSIDACGVDDVIELSWTAAVEQA